MIATSEPTAAPAPAMGEYLMTEAYTKTGRAKMNLSPEERQRRAAHIAPYAFAGGSQSPLKLYPEKAREWQMQGGKAAAQKYQEMKNALIPDGPADLCMKRRKAEAKASKLRDSLVDAAENGKKVDIRTITAAIRVLEVQIEQLWQRERDLTRSEGGDSGQRGKRAKNSVSLRNAEQGTDPESVDVSKLADK